MFPLFCGVIRDIVPHPCRSCELYILRTWDDAHLFHQRLAAGFDFLVYSYSNYGIDNSRGEKLLRRSLTDACTIVKSHQICENEYELTNHYDRGEMNGEHQARVAL